MRKLFGVLAAVFFLFSQVSYAKYKDTKPSKDLPAGAVAVTCAGSYGKAGTTYVLMNDIASPTTTVFLGKDVTLDLNGHTISFADGKYIHVPNYSFEEGMKDWDTSKAPNAKAISSKMWPMCGQKVCEIKAGEEIVSKYIVLPVAERSYYAMCAAADNEMKYSIYVEDEKGKSLNCEFKGGRKEHIGCPIENIGPKKGGGIVFAHLCYLPAGKYRIRIKAVTDCVIDEVDIRPCFDAGIAVVSGISPWATYSDMLSYYACDFFDYCKKNTMITVETVPVVKGSGEITIKNGVVKSAFDGIRWWAIHSNAKEVTIKLENVKVVTGGINTNALFASKASVKNCRFEVDTPYIINRHNTSEMSACVENLIEASDNEFIGGQGNLSFNGDGSIVRDNLFVNRQTVTNHYSVNPGGKNHKIYNNTFDAQIGSGIYLGASQNIEVYNNSFKVSTAPPNTEYINTYYSTNAIRLSDYEAAAGAKNGCINNKIYKNKFHIYAKNYPDYPRYRAQAYAFFISVGGGTNYIYDNEIVVENKDPEAPDAAFAFFIGGSTNGGEIYNNKVTSNTTVAWISNRYGDAKNTKFYNNTFIKSKNTLPKYKVFLMGNYWGPPANDIEFYSNKYEGWADSDIYKHDGTGSNWSVGWTLTVKISDKDGKPVENAEVVITDKDGADAVKDKTDAAGVLKARLPEYKILLTGDKNKAEEQKTKCSSYNVRVGKNIKSVVLDKDIELKIKQ
ncbi:MAG: hypothetical protein A2452_10365 [Candidatus Firestonebacteria bacterium RIFOXYC2_FULL_39_67]|nr:MAG: hypothetical protein A2536_06735 [Candidatus Firestonebacteria bacterium RIFOXYD2_FULL_39_29]OGF54305.1 MAG: hypothetical protein A2452_10365 [Candidatus Firestonebacteria bacterium RIFOXYC2_FULL_39_67]OGF57880.1 MAG: hypothetical protein A2497_00675 [Candidatus Firestonebacteria bacterium RifOxyC12_full_39_7]